MNLPNSITLARLVLCIVFAIACSLATPDNIAAYWVALVSFTLAAISDFLDGYLARKLNLVTSLGKLLDPLADKILVCTAFVYLTVVETPAAEHSLIPLGAGLVPAWATVLIIAREFLVTGIRQVAVEQGEVIAADRLGKNKTIFQLTFCITALVHLCLGHTTTDNFIVASLRWLSDPANFFLHAALWPAVALTALSGFNYFRNAWHLFFGQKPGN